MTRLIFRKGSELDVNVNEHEKAMKKVAEGDLVINTVDSYIKLGCKLLKMPEILRPSLHQERKFLKLIFDQPNLKDHKLRIFRIYHQLKEHGLPRVGTIKTETE